ncbi:nicotinate phosphoribosyltransferase [Lignipirellula cremea]|uniref:Nicotinate phosphoribosyltransferase n=1 Tax=Lignipirellula cremea TaxID=2528010 RepID=A0A518DNY6_9BACT|nr:nicotinate phosphoribosyltransferase [Lignipirellula cremea]QDU93523.1 Nicotinate phosphoribosyltransferase pncB2 [Lignipirellula cremea]
MGNPVYRTSLALLTDLYQLTMAYGYHRTGAAEQEAVFHLTFRKSPFGGEYALACGLATAIDWLEDFHFAADDLEYLATLTGSDDKPLFDDHFLAMLGVLELACDIDAVPEGTVVFPHEPLIRVQGPLVHCQLLETALLNILNFQTLIATKAARVCHEAQGDPVLEFGLRRAQGIDGGLSASRAAFAGGCAATSNLLAGKLYDIPVKGTHAHSWVMTFDSELEAFAAYAGALPNNCVFLVDTYNTVDGVRHAIEIGLLLRKQGAEMVGVRLDSGDLAELSIQARKLLDEGGFPEARIVASNDLNEQLIRDLKQQGAQINVWGVGTQLATAYDQPALGGVYKLAAIREPGEDWRYKVKLSEQAIKISNPGVQQVRRYLKDGKFLGDSIYDEPTGIAEPPSILLGEPLPRTVTFDAADDSTDLLVPIFRQGKRVYHPPRLTEVRERARQQLAGLSPAVTRLFNPAPYPVGLERSLYELKASLVAAAREGQV